MKLLRAIPIVLIVACAASSRAQSPSEPKFRTEILSSGSEAPQFSLTNLSEKMLTACTIEFSVSKEAKPDGEMDWDPLAQGGRGPKREPQGPLAPGATLTLYLPHRVGGPLPDKVEVVAGIWADGETFGQEMWIKTLVDHRASLVSAYELAVALLREGLEHDWTQAQYLAALNGKPNSLPFYSLRTTLEAGAGRNKDPRAVKLVVQDLLAHFTQSLSLLRPAKPAEQPATK